MKKLLLAIICSLLIISLTVLAVAFIMARNLQPNIINDDAHYERILTEIQAQGYTLMSPRDYFYSNFTGKAALLCHDVDYDTSGFVVFERVEAKLNVSSCFYLRPDADYYVQSIPVFQDLEEKGWEIGYQYCTLSRSNGDKSQALQVFKAQLTYMRAFFNVSTTNSHGDNYNSSIYNQALWNRKTWQDLGLKDLMMEPANYSYISDSNNYYYQDPLPWQDLLIVQLHTDWWNKSYLS